MTYELEKLLDVREYRENAALNKVRQDQKALDDALHNRKGMARQLFAYSKQRKHKEQQLFHKLTCKKRTIDDIDAFNQAIDHLRAKQAQMVEQLKQAQHDVSQAENNLNISKQEYAKNVREKQKIEEHKNIWAREKRLEENRLDDQRMDEISTIKRR